MSKHNSKHSGNRSPAEMMMSGRHYATGGSTGMSNSFLNAMPNNTPTFSEGGMAGSPAEMMMSGWRSASRKGGRPKSYVKNGRACHAEGDSVTHPENPVTGHKYGKGPVAYSESVGQLRKGGAARRRRRHAEGDSVGDDSPQEKYMYDQNLRKGGRTRRRHHAEGDSAEGVPFRKGGRARHGFGETIKKVGGKAFDALTNIAPLLLPLMLREGGSTENEARKLAMGGAGKVRKGMMTRKGRMI